MFSIPSAEVTESINSPDEQFRLSEINEDPLHLVRYKTKLMRLQIVEGVLPWRARVEIRPWIWPPGKAVLIRTGIASPDKRREVSPRSGIQRKVSFSFES
jgi:hypothetical protein